MPPDLKAIDQLFHATLELPAAERAAFLAGAVDDEDVRAQVLSLLRAHEAASGYFRGLAAGIPAVGEAEPPPDEPIQIGPYRALKILGRGGMGTVYLAERVDGQFSHQVALKVIRVGMDTQDGVRRFLAERQIVARLEHPNIARLLDGGLTEDGRPYFVMEYVDGRPLAEYCDDRVLPIARRLDLVIAAADAIQYAHQSLVVHRDVKPSNILVTADGTVKLVDFGIAKLLDPAAESNDAATETGQRVLTLPYAAPEQVQGGRITTATDVFALGVVLYELLTGRRPHDQPGGNPREVERAIVQHVPVKPSTAVEAQPDAAARRGTKPERLRRQLTGDLDTIVLMALRKEPERRYGSAGQLADDLRRYRRGRPVHARPDTWRYRTSKFVRRHALAVTAAAASIVLLAALAAVAIVQSTRAARERDKAQEITELMIRLFEVADPGEARGASVTAREVLNRGVARMQSSFGDQPELKATLLAVMGRVYQNLGLFREASPLVEQALALRREQLGPSHREVIAGMTTLGELFRLRGEFAQAGSLLREALPLAERVHGSAAPETARVLNGLSKVHVATGKAADAEQLARRALEITRTSLGPAHVETGESLMNLGAALFVRGDDAAAEPLFREALAVRRQALGPDHPNVPAALNNLAALLTRRGALAEAEAVHRESLEINRRIFGAEHPRVATSLNNLALVLFTRADYSGAEPIFRESLAMRRKLLDASHVDIAQSLANLGLLLQQTSRLEEAETLYRDALTIRQQALGPTHALVAQSGNNLALLLQARGQLEAAEPLFRQSLETLRAQLGNAHPLVATSLHNLGALRRARRDAGGAERFYREALAIRRTALPAQHADTILTLVGLGQTLVDAGRARDAEPVLVEAHSALAARRSPSADVLRQRDEARAALIRAYEAIGDTAQVQKLRAAASPNGK